METTAPGTSNEALERGPLCPDVTFRVSLYRSRTSGRVVYVEVGKEFVDTLLSFLLLPLGTIIHILSAGIQVKPALGGISRIYESVQKFSVSDLDCKENLLQPRPAAIGCSCRSAGLPMQKALEAASILPLPLQRPGLVGDYYRCGNCHGLAQTSRGTACLKCHPKGPVYYYCTQGPYYVIEREPCPYIISPCGFVKGNTMFIVTDNLEIMSQMSDDLVNVLCQSFDDVERSDITVTITQILQLLQSALTSDTCLSDVFGSP